MRTPCEAIHSFLNGVPMSELSFDLTGPDRASITNVEWLIRGYMIGLQERIGANGKPEPEEDDE